MTTSPSTITGSSTTAVTGSPTRLASVEIWLVARTSTRVSRAGRSTVSPPSGSGAGSAEPAPVRSARSPSGAGASGAST